MRTILAIISLLSVSLAQGNIPLELGGGCRTSIGTDPRIIFLLGENEFPRIGCSNQSEVDGCVPGQLIEVYIGWSYLDLPIDIDLLFGTTGGCLFYPAPDTATPSFVGPTGEAFFSFPIPNDPTLVGVNFRLQATVPDPGASAGFVLSNAFQILL